MHSFILGIFGLLRGSGMEVDTREIQWVMDDKIASSVKWVEEQSAGTLNPRAPDKASPERSNTYVNAQ